MKKEFYFKIQKVYSSMKMSVNMFCPEVHLCPKPLLHFSNRWALFAERWLFTSVIQDINVTVGLKLLTTGPNVTMVLCAQGKKLNMV